MYGELDTYEIETLLSRERIGRLGVHSEERVYVFPICYGYDGGFIYLVSHDGLKVRLMRSHPEACLEVDQVSSPAEWRSVLVHGRFEELTDEAARDAAMAVIVGQGDTALPSSIAPYVDGPENIVAYRLQITEVTGRYERSQPLALTKP